MNKRTEKWGIYAPNKGIVALAYDSSDYGLTVIIEYPCGTRTLHAHNSKLLVETGDRVEREQLIAIMGDTGRGIPKPNKHSHLGCIPKGRPLTNLNENCINPVPFLIRNNCAYPTNTKVSGAFQEDYGSYYHEGIDFSGLEENIIDNWENGINANTQYYYKK
ncbi:MAG: M23 family metallopeptidase [Candidatus Woesearchaeota archaeon]|jgi:hypothetical protein|nr:M23 family metallopeptidase [Candidatus Woesearchaeota archaeon]